LTATFLYCIIVFVGYNIMLRMIVKKKKWKTPKLIVLVRGDRSEGVLTACKAGGTGDTIQPINYDSACNSKLAPGGCCPCLHNTAS